MDFVSPEQNDDRSTDEGLYLMWLGGEEKERCVRGEKREGEEERERRDRRVRDVREAVFLGFSERGAVFI